MLGSWLPKPPSTGGGLSVSDFTVVGFETLTMSQAGDNIQLTYGTGTANQCGITRNGVNETDVRVTARLQITGWGTGSDQVLGGPACRIRGTDLAADWDAYLLAMRRWTNDTFRIAPRKFVSGTSSGHGTQTTGLSSSAWLGVDVDLRLTVSGSLISYDYKLASDANYTSVAAWTNSDVPADTTNSVGLFFQNFTDAVTVTLKSFDYEAL